MWWQNELMNERMKKKIIQIITWQHKHYIIITKKMKSIFINFLWRTRIVKTVDSRVIIRIIFPIVWNSILCMVYLLNRLFHVLSRIRIIVAIISIVRKWPELCCSSRSFHHSKNIFPINVPCDRHFLLIHVYLHRIHSYTYRLMITRPLIMAKHD